MKFVHLGDLHLGRSIGDFDLIDDQKFILDEILQIAVDQKAKAVLIAGDVYDKAIPSEKAVNLFDQFLTNLNKAGLKTFVISGNHDSDERLNFGSGFFESNGLFISAKYEKELYCQPIQDEFGKVNVYLMPFVKASQVRSDYPDAKIENYDDAVRTLIEHAHVDTSQRNVIVAHQFVVGRGSSDDSKYGGVELGGSEGLAVQNVGTIEQIGSDCFDAFEYVALGHIHSGQKVGRETCRYAGSPLKYSLSEVGHKKSVPVVTIGEKGTDVKVELVELKPQRDMRELKGPLKQLINQDNIVDSNDFIHIILTDEEVEVNFIGILRDYYPNIIKAEYQNSHTHVAETFELTQASETLSYEDLIRKFYIDIYKTEITPEELEIMLEVGKKEGLVYEAD